MSQMDEERDVDRFEDDGVARVTPDSPVMLQSSLKATPSSKSAKTTRRSASRKGEEKESKLVHVQSEDESAGAESTRVIIDKPARERKTNSKKRRKRAQEEENDNDSLEGYTPLKKRVQQGNIAEVVQATAGVVPATTLVVAPPARQQSDEDKISLRMLRTLPKPEDLGLANVGPAKLKCLWPVKRIHNLTALSKSDQDFCRGNGWVSGAFDLREDVHLYVRIEGKDKWFLYNLPQNKKVYAFEDEEQRAKIEKALKGNMTGKSNVPRVDLKAAMNVAEEMLRVCKAKMVIYEELPQEEAPTQSSTRIQPVRGTIVLPHQRIHNQKACPTEFKAGVVIAVNVLGHDVKKVKITEVKRLDDTPTFHITLEDDTILTDDTMVGTMENDNMFPYNELRTISKFTESKEGETFSSRMTSAAQALNEKLHAQRTKMESTSLFA